MRYMFAATALVAALAACSAQPMATTPGTAPSVGPSAATATPIPTRPDPDDRDWLVYGLTLHDSVKGAYLAHRNGASERRILGQVDGDIRSIGWINSDRISFVVRDTAHPDGAIWTAGFEGDAAALFYDGRADGCDGVFHPQWSPDESRVSMVCYRPAGSTLAVLDVASRKLEFLATYVWPEFLDNPARWSPDGATLVYDILHWDPSDTFVDGSRVATIPTDGSAEPRYLNAFASNAARPSWSVDGTALIYNTFDWSSVHDDVASDILTMRPDGTGVEPFLTASQAGVVRLAQPLWEQDGSRVWVCTWTGSAAKIAWIDATTRQLTILPNEGSGAEPRR